MTGSGGREIATATAEALKFQFIDRNAMDMVIDQQFPVRTEQLSRIKKDRRVNDEMVRSATEERDREKETSLKTLYGKDWRDPAFYDLVFNIDHFSNEIAVEIIVKAAQAKGIEATAVELPAQLR